jgi:D-tyrosyl-tRNA(Tyr) deacylase
MKGLLQRVRGARVEVAGEIVGAVDQGLLVLVAVEPDDTRASADKLLHKLLNYRVFSDAEGKMNCPWRMWAAGCCWSLSSPWLPTPRAGCAQAFSTAASGLGRGIVRLSFAAAKQCMALWHQVDSARICRCTWSMMAR